MTHVTQGWSFSLGAAGVLALGVWAWAHGDAHGDAHGGAMGLLDARALTEEQGNKTELEEIEPSHAVLFPAFAELLGVATFFLISRVFDVLPYTAVLFIFGTLIGVSIGLNNGPLSVFAESVILWANIDSEVLLLVFLPGLLFGDALQVNFHLFEKGFWQIMLLAFPAVLLGTFLTACVAFYILPYGWSFSASMTFGAILSATDPVAVMALLKEVGAPPRLNMLVSGESMFNDGSAIVFFTIFSQLAAVEFGLHGEPFTVASGFAKFFQMSLGGAAIGLVAGAILVLLLWLFNRSLSKEDSIMQVASTITIAYLTYFVAEVICGTSGVIAVVVCGIFTNVFGLTSIHNRATLSHVWDMLEHLLNTLLFVLAGTIWGNVLADRSATNGYFTGKDWGYLLLLFLFLLVIRFVLLLLAYPIITRIGLRTNWREVTFMWWGGLRGAVGLALAIALDNNVFSQTTAENDLARRQSTVLFINVGGIAFLTLLINGTSSAQLIKRLGLTDSSAARMEIVRCITEKIRQTVIDELLIVLQDPRFKDVHFRVIQHHVSALQGLSSSDLRLALKRHKEGTAPVDYSEPYIASLLAALPDGDTVMSGLKHDLAQVQPGSQIIRGDTEEGSDPSSSAVARAMANFATSAASHAGPSSAEFASSNDNIEYAIEHAYSMLEDRASAKAGRANGTSAAIAGLENRAVAGDGTTMIDKTKGSASDDLEQDEELGELGIRDGPSADGANDEAYAVPSMPQGSTLKMMHNRYNSSSRGGRQKTHVLARDTSQRLTSKAELPDQTRDKLESVMRSNRRLRAASRKRGLVTVAQAAVLQRAVELREIFLELLRHAYWELISRAELGENQLVEYLLLQSLEISMDEVQEGGPLDDWAASKVVAADGGWSTWLSSLFSRWIRGQFDLSKESTHHYRISLRVLKAINFIEAHKIAEHAFQVQFAEQIHNLSSAEALVMRESRDGIAKATAVLDTVPEKQVQLIKSHVLCSVLLSKQGDAIAGLAGKGLLKAREAETLLEVVRKDLMSVGSCAPSRHKDDIPGMAEALAAEFESSRGSKGTSNEVEAEAAASAAGGGDGGGLDVEGGPAGADQPADRADSASGAK